MKYAYIILKHWMENPEEFLSYLKRQYDVPDYVTVACYARTWSAMRGTRGWIGLKTPWAKRAEVLESLEEYCTGDDGINEAPDVVSSFQEANDIINSCSLGGFLGVM